MDLKFGTQVMAEDGRVGSVERVILHPETREVDAIVVVNQEILPDDVMVPVERILSADDRGVWVRGTVEEVRSLDGFAFSQYVEAPEDWLPPTDAPSSFYLFPASPYLVGALTPPPTHPSPPAREVEDMPEEGDREVSASTTVLCGKSPAGRLSHVVTQGETDHVTHLVVRTGGRPTREVVVPVEHIVSLGDEGVVLDMEEEELDQMPLFSPRS